ncbi:uncharacterized protein LOC114600252 [Podarcis muralis]
MDRTRGKTVQGNGYKFYPYPVAIKVFWGVGWGGGGRGGAGCRRRPPGCPDTARERREQPAAARENHSPLPPPSLHKQAGDQPRCAWLPSPDPLPIPSPAPPIPPPPSGERLLVAATALETYQATTLLRDSWGADLRAPGHGNSCPTVSSYLGLLRSATRLLMLSGKPAWQLLNAEFHIHP